LRPLTRLIEGDERPKQFCRILGRETLLERTLGRATRSVQPSRTVVALTQTHERFYAPWLKALPPGIAVIQPANRGTAPAILYALLRVERQTPLGAVALMPSDHYVSDDAAFMAHVDAAFDAVDRRPDLAVLLGVTPTSPETEYGWIEPADALPVTSPALLLRVRQFWEKPTRLVAESLLERGCLWNSFVIVARVPALLAAMRQAIPALVEAFGALRPVLGGAGEVDGVTRLYAGLGSVNFSQEVLERPSANLAVLPVRGLDWSDWGKPARVLATLDHLEQRPDWLAAARAVPA
jgi:mannose-1-phosphate guanylyltransferase